jgi:hypothetical protein
LYKKAIYVLLNAKQHLGFLKEQSIHYAAYIASIHLVAIRFCMLIGAKHNSVALKSSAIFFSRSVCTDLLNPGPEQLLYYFCRWSIGISVCHGTASFKLGI